MIGIFLVAKGLSAEVQPIQYLRRATIVLILKVTYCELLIRLQPVTPALHRADLLQHVVDALFFSSGPFSCDVLPRIGVST